MRPLTFFCSVLVAGSIASLTGCVMPLSDESDAVLAPDTTAEQGVFGNMRFLSVTEGNTYDNPTLLQVSAPTSARYVVYSADGFVLGVATDRATAYAIRARFTVTGERTLVARAFDIDDRQVGEVSARVIIDNPQAPPSLTWTSPATEGGSYLNGMWLKVRATGPVYAVRYSADGYEIGESAAASDEFPFRYTFTQAGTRTLKAEGLSREGQVVASALRTIVVVDPNAPPAAGGGASGGGASSGGSPGSSATTRSGIAQEILNHHDQNRLTLWNESFGRRDGADPLSNISDTAAGHSALTSCYGTAPCTAVNLSTSLLRAMRSLREQYGYSYFVTAIAGANHSPGSYHYAGRAFDIDEINGVRIYGNSSRAQGFMDACWALGAVEVYGPSNDPNGHYDHIHCAF